MGDSPIAAAYPETRGQAANPTTCLTSREYKDDISMFR
ncbi:uncharacterized protein Dmul_15300 [Desulfococcus multivorans]|nr:uncharacterized protein Dmul_15300 [Desulfococcus multivorans]